MIRAAKLPAIQLPV